MTDAGAVVPACDGVFTAKITRLSDGRGGQQAGRGGGVAPPAGLGVKRDAGGGGGGGGGVEGMGESCVGVIYILMSEARRGRRWGERKERGEGGKGVFLLLFAVVGLLEPIMPLEKMMPRQFQVQ